MFKHRITWRDLEDERIQKDQRRRDIRFILFTATLYAGICAVVLYVNL